MSHRTFKIGVANINVFDSAIAADRFRKRHTEGDLTILVRKHSYFMRRNGGEMTVSLRRPERAEASHILAAAKAVSDEIERLIEAERAAA